MGFVVMFLSLNGLIWAHLGGGFFLGTSDGDLCNLDRIGQLVTDLIMWNDVAKSSLWFGFGSLCVLSSCFAKGVSFRYAISLHLSVCVKRFL